MVSVGSTRKIWLGRAREMVELEAALDGLRAGRGGLFLATGEPGIGKTRLADELSRAAVARGVAVHWGRAWETGGAPAYWPITQALRSICRKFDDTALRERVGAHAAHLIELMPELARRLDAVANAPRQRFQLFDTVTSFLQETAVRSPQLLVFDDLHAAGGSSLQLLHFLVKHLRGAPLLVLGTYREAEVRLAADLRRALAALQREATVLSLRRLSAAEVADFFTQATGCGAPKSGEIEALYRRTEGNPLFLHELLRLASPADRPPEGIAEVVRARLELLPVEVRPLLEAAAVLGREFTVAELAALGGTSELELASLLAPAADAGIVEAVDPSLRWRFTHVLLCEELYARLPPERRAALHLSAARVFERGGHERLSAFAHHLLRARPAVSEEEAARAALDAAERAMGQLGFEEAASLYERAGALLEHEAPHLYFEALLGAGVARIRAGDTQAGKAACTRAASVARQLDDGERLARAVLGSTCEHPAGIRDLELIAWLEESLARLPAGDSALKARCLVQLAVERHAEPDMRPVTQLAFDGVEMARRLGDVETLRVTLANAGLALSIHADLAEREPLDLECLRLALAAGDTLMALRAHLFLLGDCAERGDRAGLHAHLAAYQAVADNLGYARFQWICSCLRAFAALWDGRFAEAEEIFGRTREDDDALADGASMAAFPAGLSAAREELDRLSEIESKVRKAFGSLYQDLGGCIGEMLIAQLYGRAGNRERAAAQMQAVRAYPIFAAIRDPVWLSLLAEPCCLLGDSAMAERLYDALLPRAALFHMLGPVTMYVEPPYARQLGLLAAVLGRIDLAIEHLTEAEERTARAGMRGCLARLRCELASLLIRRAAAGDRARVILLLEQARSVAEELGQRGLLPWIAELAQQSGSAPSPVEHAGFSLVREGEYWTVSADSQTLRLKNSRGLQVLDRLVGHPGQEFHVLQLMGGDVQVGEPGDAGELLDDEALRSYRQRLLDLRAELSEAEGINDTGRAERARRETDMLTRELARAVGLGGRERRAGDAAERARTTIQKRLRDTIRRIEDGLPGVGRHLDQTIRTGIFCGYLPDGFRRSRR